MRRFDLTATVLWLVPALWFFALPALALEEKAGAFYFGDSGAGADGIIAPTDAVALKIQIAGGSASYSDVKPPVKDVQDLDGDAVLSPTDLTKLNAWIQGNFADPTGTGKPFSIEVLTPFPTVGIGQSVELQARVYDNPANGNLLATLRPGWGVEFEILPTSTCPIARLSGLDPTPFVGGGKGQTIMDTLVYGYTDSFANGGIVKVKVWAMACSWGDHIYVRAHVPGDSEAGILGGRFPVALYAPVDIDIFISDVIIESCSSITIDQANGTTIVETQSKKFSATCTWMGSPFVTDCTNDATWTVLGDLTNSGSTVTANQIPGPNGGSGTVTATWSDCVVSPSDSKNIIVLNNDALQYTEIRPTSASIGELATQQFQLWEHYSDGFERQAGSATWGVSNNTCDTASTITAGGLFTAGHKFCGGGCSAQVTATGAINSPLTVTIVNDETVTSTLISPASAMYELASQQFTLYRTWSDSCVDYPATTWGVADDTCDTASSINASGLFTAGHKACGAGCSARVTAAGAANSPLVTITNGDYQITLFSPTPVDILEGQTLQMHVIRTWSDACVEDLTNGAAWQLNGCGTGTITSAGLFTAGQYPCGAGGSCLISLSSFPAPDNSPAQITILNDDVLTSLRITPDPATVQEGKTQQFSLRRIWSDGCNENLTNGAGWSVSGSNCEHLGSITANGLYTAGWTACDLGCSEQISTSAPVAQNSPLPVTVANFRTIVSTRISPAAVTLSEGGSQQFQLLRTWSDGCNEDLTATAGWVFNSSNCTTPGTLTPGGFYTAGQKACGLGCSEGVYTTSPMADNLVTVTVNNDDTIVSSLISPSPVTAPEGQSLQFTLTRTWSDACAENLSAGAGWSVTNSDCTVPGTISVNGLYLGGKKACLGGCQEEVRAPAADNNPVPITLTENGTIVSTLITPAPVTVQETHNQQFQLIRTWSDTCVEDLTAAAGWALASSSCSTSGAITSGGLYTAGHQACGQGCSEQVSAASPVADNSPLTVTVSNDETIVSTLISPSALSLLEGSTQPFALNRLWSDACSENIAAGAGWSVVNSTCSSAGTVTANGLYSAGQKAGGLGCAEQARSSTPAADNNPIAVTVTNDDVLVSTLISPSPANLSEGANLQLALTRKWSDNFTENLSNGAGWALSAGCSNSSITANGLLSAGQYPCGAGAACSVSTASPAADNNPVPIAVANDDTIVSTLISPAPGFCFENETIPFSLLRKWTDNCAEDLTTTAGWAISGGDCSASAIGPATGLFTAGDYPGQTAPACLTGIVADNYAAGNAPVTTVVYDDDGGTAPPVIAAVFPLDFADRFRKNAHLDQHLTVVIDLIHGSAPTAVTATCGAIDFNCNTALVPDVICTPPSNLAERTVYACNVTVTNLAGFDVASGSMQTTLATAPADGGMAGGYIGGLDWDSATGKTVGNFNVVLRPINDQTHAQIQQKVYAQIIQGGTVIERFLSPTGTTTLTQADLGQAPINELTLGFKCGLVNCPKRELGATMAEYRQGNATNYQYQTFYNLDASELNLPMSLLSSAETGRYKARITGTINAASFNTYIAPQPAVVYAQTMFKAPVKLRAGFVFPSRPGTVALASGLDTLLLTPDYQVSISLCLSWGAPAPDMRLKAVLPPNLVLPELRRTNWTGACTTWTSNPSYLRFQTWTFTPNTTALIWSLGAYVNASNLVPPVYMDFFSFPMFACAFGARAVTIPAGLANGDTFVRMGTNASWTYDLREAWTTPSGPTGFDPDNTIDRKVLLAMTGRLPIDPARRDATLTGGAYHTPQKTDSALWPDATWDDRFYRKHTLMATDGDFGLSYGLGVTGLSLWNKINDNQFTVFAVSYVQSTVPKYGIRDLSYWSGGGTTQVVSIQQAGINSTWTGPATLPAGFFAERVDGGAANYSAVVALLRQAPKVSSISSMLDYVGPRFNPGSVISVWQVGAAQKIGNEAIPVADFLNLPEAVAPNADDYLYPAPQWSNTPNTSDPINRNGELLRVSTVSAADAIPRDGLDPWNRLYFEFTRPSMMNATSRVVHAWSLSLAEPDLRTSGKSALTKLSMKTKVRSTKGATSAAGTYIFTDATAHFITQGVKVADTLWVDSRRYARRNLRFNISAVNSETSLTQNTYAWGTGATTLPGAATNVRYKVLRKTVSGVAARGECIIDEFYGGGPGGYTCKPNTFWKAQGPVLGTGNVRAHVPDLTPGAATLNGTTGVIPSLWEGTDVAGTQLEWTYNVSVYNTDPFNQGGLWSAAPFAFDWNNQQWRLTQGAIQHLATDSSFALYQ